MDFLEYYQQNKGWYGDAPLEEVAKDVYTRAGHAEKQPDYEKWKKDFGISDVVKADTEQRRPKGFLDKLSEGVAHVSPFPEDITKSFVKGATWGYAPGPEPVADESFGRKTAKGIAHLAGMAVGLAPVAATLPVSGTLAGAAATGAALGGIYGLLRKPEEGETRLGNLGTDAATFAAFGVGGKVVGSAIKTVFPKSVGAVFEKVEANRVLSKIKEGTEKLTPAEEKFAAESPFVKDPTLAKITDADKSVMKLAEYGSAATLGAGAGAIEPAENWEERFKNIASGALTFAGAHGVSSGIASAVKAGKIKSKDDLTPLEQAHVEKQEVAKHLSETVNEELRSAPASWSDVERADTLGKVGGVLKTAVDHGVYSTEEIGTLKDTLVERYGGTFPELKTVLNEVHRTALKNDLSRGIDMIMKEGHIKGTELPPEMASHVVMDGFKSGVFDRADLDKFSEKYPTMKPLINDVVIDKAVSDINEQLGIPREAARMLPPGQGFELGAGPAREFTTKGEPYGPEILRPGRTPEEQAKREAVEAEIAGVREFPEKPKALPGPEEQALLGLERGREETKELPAGQGFELVTPEAEKPPTPIDEKAFKDATRVLPYMPKNMPTEKQIAVLQEADRQGKLDKEQKAVLARHLPDQFKVEAEGAKAPPVAAAEKPAVTPEAKPTAQPKTGKKTGAVNLIGRLGEMGGISAKSLSGKKETLKIYREDVDLKRVLKTKGGVSLDQAASNLNDEGWKPADGTEWTADKLKTALESKEGRETLAPEKAEDVITRKLRKDENEWIERELARINEGITDEEKIDAGTVEASRADLRDSFIEKARSEGLIDPAREEEAAREIADYFESVGKEEGKRPAEDIKFSAKPKAEEELTGQELAFQLEEKKKQALADKLEQREGERRSQERLAAEGGEEKARGRRRTQQERRAALADRHDEIFAMDPEDMTRAEMDYFIITDDFTGLGSKMAYRHTPKKAHQAFVDLDSLKWVNDSVSHAAGDEFLASMGEAIKATDLKTDSYHISGDEFYVQADTPEQIKAAMDQAYKYLETHPIAIVDDLGRDWEFPGGFSYGIGRDIREAERAQKLHKIERELQGKRSGRGVQPPGIHRKSSELSGDQDQREVFSKPETEKVNIETIKTNRSLGAGRITEDADGAVHVTFPGNVGFKIDFITDKADQGIELVTSYGTFPKTFKDKIYGAYIHKDKVILINTDEAGNPTITHEFTHFLEQSGYFDSRDVRILNLSAKKYGLKMDAEGRAETLARGFEERDKANTFLKQVMQKVRDFVDMAYNAVGGRTERSIMRDIESGKIFKREFAPFEGTGPAVMYSLGEQIDKTLAKVTQTTDRVRSIKNAREGVSVAYDGLKRIFNPASRSEDAQTTAEILIERMGHNYKQTEQVKAKLNEVSKQYSKATTVTAKALDLMQSSTGVMADGLFNRMPKEKQYDFIERIQTDQPQATKELQGMADTISKMFDDLWAEANEVVPGSTKYRENYFPGMWEKPAEAQKFFSQHSRSMEGTKAHTKAKVFDTIADGIAAGYVPRGTPIDMAFEKLHDMQKYVTAHRVLNDMVTDKTAMLVKAGEKAPNGYKLIPEPYGIVTKRLQLKEGEFEEASYRYAAKEDVAQVINNYLSRSLYENVGVGKIYEAYMGAANSLNMFQLGFGSAFHAGFTAMESVISHNALGLKRMAAGDIAGAAKMILESPLQIYRNPMLGDKLMRAYRGESIQGKDIPQMIQWLEMAGARASVDNRMQTTHTSKMLAAFAEGRNVAAIARSPVAMVEQMARPILEYLVPRQKFGVFAEMATEWHDQNPKATYEDTRTAMQYIWNRVDSRMGQVVYDRLFINKTAKNLMQGLMRAPGWTGGTMIEIGGGVADFGKVFNDISHGRKPVMTDKMAYTMSLLLTTGLINGVMTKLMTGEDPKDARDLLAFKTGKMDEHGNPERFLLPTYAKDIYAYMNKPGQTLLNKTHPLLSLMADVAKNKDYYGVQVREKEEGVPTQAAQIGIYAAKAFVPFWMRGYQKEVERGQKSFAATLSPLIGIMPATAEFVKTDAQKLMSDLLQERPKGSMTRKDFEQNQLKRRLEVRLRNEDQTAHEEMAELVREGKLSRKDVRTINKDIKTPYALHAFRSLTVDEAMRVFSIATPEEKSQFLPILRHKIRGARELPAEQREGIMGRFQEIMREQQ